MRNTGSNVYNYSAQLAALDNEVMTSQYVAIRADFVLYAIEQYNEQYDIITSRYIDATDRLRSNWQQKVRRVENFTCTQATLVRR